MKVATDNLNGDDWFFDDGWYVQKRSGEEISRLSSRNFPNPWTVWNAKVTKSGAVLQRELTEEERNRLKPRDYIFKIWDHRENA